jgi:tetratricopeptide (TPR) repeat protein
VTQGNQTARNPLNMRQLMDEAVPYLLEAGRISPQDYRVHRTLGKAYAQLNQLEKARGELERAAELSPQNAQVHLMLAEVYRKQGLLDKAKQENDRYIQLAGPNAPGNQEK